MKQSRLSLLMFLIGLFSQTQVRVVGSIAISELVMFIIAPFVLFSHLKEFKRDKVTTALNLLLLAFVGAIVSSLHNSTPMAAALRGIASPYGFWAGLVIFYYLLRKSPLDFKWYLLGSAISFVMCTFVFQQATEMYIATGSGLGSAEASEIMSGPIYWIGRLNGFVMWPIQGFYMKCPLAYSAIGSFVFGAWSLLTSASGRSSALVAMLSTTLICLGRKSPANMKRIRRRIFPLLCVVVVVVFAFKTAYTYMAENGSLGEKAQKKFEQQTKGRKDLLHIIMGGRIEPFIGTYACIINPIWGYGPWAEDRTGIRLEFLSKYGDYEDYVQSEKVVSYNLRYGGRMLIPAHSAIIGWWIWYGILGVPIWFYILYLVYDFFKRRVGEAPEMFGYFACTIPTTLWAMFFSPFGARLTWSFFVAVLLVHRAIAMDKQRMNKGILGWQTSRFQL